MSATLEKPKPGLAAALLVPLLIWVVTSVVAIVFVVIGFQRATDVADDFARVPDGQQTTVSLSEAGDYRIWLDDGGRDTFSPSATATITGPDGEQVVANTYVGSLEFNDLEAVLTFEAPQAGEYQFEITEDEFSSTAAGSGEFAIGKDNPLGEVGKGFLIMALIGSAGFLIALILMIVMLVRRGRSKKRITQAAIQSGAYGGYPQPGGYPQQGGYPPSGSSW